MSEPLARSQRAFAEALLSAAPAHPGLEIYRTSSRETHLRVLADAFPVVARLVGDDYFAQAAHRYFLAWPSAAGDLHRFGAAFADFLAAEPSTANLPWLADVARLEWARSEASHADDAPSVDARTLAAALGRGEDVVRLVPCAKVVRSAWPVLAIWEANQPGCDGTPSRDTGDDRVLVWRDGSHEVRMRCLDADEAGFVAALAGGKLFAEALEAFTVGDGERVRTAVARLASDGLLAA